jgi:Ca-activated chloride channel family protein
VTFGAGWALAGLALLVPLVILHLRPRTRTPREQPSLLLWRGLESDATTVSRRPRLPPLPLLLVLQALALIALVLALADPSSGGSPRPPATVIVLDNSFWMQAPGRLADERNEAERIIAAAPNGAPVRIVEADGTPAVVYRGPAAGAGAILRGLRAGASAPDLPAAIVVASGLLTGSHDRLAVIRAPEDELPRLRAGPGELRTAVSGTPITNQGITDPSARCGIGSAATCEIVATVANSGTAPVVDHIVADVPGHPPLSLSARVGGRSSAPIELLAAPGEHVELRLQRVDALPVDDRAWIAVPQEGGLARPANVTVVGERATALSVAQALAADPGVRLRVETPAHYRPAQAHSSDLVVVDGSLPGPGLPPAPAVLLLDPRRLPDGHVAGALANPTLSGTDPSSPLLADVDLSGLTVEQGASRRLVLPRWLTPVAWSPSGPLLAAGDDGGTRLAVLSFAPTGSNLPQLSSFPILIANIADWGLGWTPASAAAGAPVRIDTVPGARTATVSGPGIATQRVSLRRGGTVVQAPATPGLYTVAETGPGVVHQATLAVNLGTPQATPATPIDVRTSGLHAGRAPGSPLALWPLAAGLLLVVLEWAYWALRRERVTA